MDRAELGRLLQEVYLGDGLYASLDGITIKLRAPREHEDHEVFLDSDMLRDLIKFARERSFL